MAAAISSSYPRRCVAIRTVEFFSRQMFDGYASVFRQSHPDWLHAQFASAHKQIYPSKTRRIQ
jgi:hypothetical protein